MLITRPATNAEVAKGLRQSMGFLAEAEARLSGRPAGGTRAEIYVASRASIQERSAMWRQLRDDGVPIISSWIDEAGPGQTASMEKLWERIQQEVAQCCGLILYAEQGDLPLKGAFIEAGMALAMNKTVAVVWPPGITNLRSLLGSWVDHPKVVAFDDVRYAADWILKEWGRSRGQ